jgi:hypothetical protein
MRDLITVIDHNDGLEVIRFFSFSSFIKRLFSLSWYIEYLERAKTPQATTTATEDITPIGREEEAYPAAPADPNDARNDTVSTA